MRVRMIPTALALLLWGLAASAAADGQIRSLRLGTHSEYDRLVFDLGPNAGAAFRVPGLDELSFEADPPPLDTGTRQKLSDLGVRVAPSEQGTRVAIATSGRRWVAFRLRASSPGASDRVVLDLAKGSAALQIPSDAQALPPLPASRAAPAPPTPPQTPSPPPRTTAQGEPSGSSLRDDVWVSLNGIQFEGLSGTGPTRDELLDLQLTVSVGEDGQIVPFDAALRTKQLSVRELADSDRVSGALLQALVQRIAEAYAARGWYGTRIDIMERDLQRLVDREVDALRIFIAETGER